ncbi:MAG: hypothetical protein EOO54_14240 [Haliea sp.]|nr:MAG: hypothetical protein EOO54_14240 [Haliea sp.]
MSLEALPPAARPAWTSWWVWMGAAVFFGGLLTAGRALGGYGHPATCGTLSLGCFSNAVTWLAATQGVAAVLLWKGARRQAGYGAAKAFCQLAAGLALLMFLAATFFVVVVVF